MWKSEVLAYGGMSDSVGREEGGDCQRSLHEETPEISYEGLVGYSPNPK